MMLKYARYPLFMSRHFGGISRHHLRDLERIASHTFCMLRRQNRLLRLTAFLRLLSSDPPTLNTGAYSRRRSEVFGGEPVTIVSFFTVSEAPCEKVMTVYVSCEKVIVVVIFTSWDHECGKASPDEGGIREVIMMVWECFRWHRDQQRSIIII